MSMSNVNQHMSSRILRLNVWGEVGGHRPGETKKQTDWTAISGLMFTVHCIQPCLPGRQWGSGDLTSPPWSTLKVGFSLYLLCKANVMSDHIVKVRSGEALGSESSGFLMNMNDLYHCGNKRMKCLQSRCVSIYWMRRMTVYISDEMNIFYKLTYLVRNLLKLVLPH